MPLTCLPRQVSECLRVLEPSVRHRRQMIFNWLLVLHPLCGERATLKGLARRWLQPGEAA
jgi:hypothetical protein